MAIITHPYTHKYICNFQFRMACVYLVLLYILLFRIFYACVWVNYSISSDRIYWVVQMTSTSTSRTLVTIWNYMLMNDNLRDGHLSKFTFFFLCVSCPQIVPKVSRVTNYPKCVNIHKLSQVCDNCNAWLQYKMHAKLMYLAGHLKHPVCKRAIKYHL